LKTALKINIKNNKHMRANLLSFFFFLGLVAGANSAFATDYYWRGTSSTDWNTGANWSTSSGGSGGLVVPGQNDVAIFDGASTNDCDINTSIQVTEIQLGLFFPNVVTLNNSATIGTLTINGGAFDAGTNPVSILNGINMAGAGEFFSTTDKLTLIGNFTINGGGTFYPNGGIVEVQRNSTLTGNIDFDFLILNSTGTGRTITVTNTINVAKDLTLQGNKNLTLNTGTINLKGDLYCYNTGTNGGGTALINLNNPISGTNQSITGAASANQCRLPKIKLS
jgi:hypothetical protein